MKPKLSEKVKEQREEYYLMGQVKLRFGKWAGYMLSQVPVDYLKFLHRTQQGDPCALIDIGNYITHPLFAEREKYEVYEKSTDITPIPRAFRR